VNRGQLSLLKELISAGQPINVFDISHRTPLHLAVSGGHFDCVEWLLKSGADPDSQARGEDHSSPLHQVKDDAVCDLLLQWKANVNAKDGWGYTPLHIAAKDGHKLVVQNLLSHGARLNTPDDMKRTPLHLAAQAGRLAICKILVRAGANVRLYDNHNWTALKCAQTFRETEVSKFLQEIEDSLPKETLPPESLAERRNSADIVG